MRGATPILPTNDYFIRAVATFAPGACPILGLPDSSIGAGNPDAAPSHGCRIRNDRRSIAL
jgi:hypothetical protein